MNAFPASTRLGPALAIILACARKCGGADRESAPVFTLPRFETGQLVQLRDFAGQIVVLDFFAYWCAPCRRSAPELEEKVQKYYATRNGSPHGIPVRLLSINVEQANPRKTAEFIQSCGLNFVLNDAEGKTLKAYDGAGLPFLVVLDGSTSRSNTPAFKMVYQNAGFEGAEKLRRIIDGISRQHQAVVQPSATNKLEQLLMPPHDPVSGAVTSPLPLVPASAQNTTPTLHAPPSPPATMPTPATSKPAAFDTTPPAPARIPELNQHERVPRSYELGAAFEAIWASDLLLTEASLAYKQTGPTAQWTAEVFRDSIHFDYQPVSFDFQGHRTTIEHERYGTQWSLRYRLSRAFTLLASAGAYDGFTDFHSAWLAEYFRQQYSRFAIPGDRYLKPDPEGYHFSEGLRWEYLAAAAFIEADVAYARDIIAPGYEIDFNGLHRGRDNLNTTTVSISAENVLTKRIRALNELHVIDTTARETRFAYQGSINLALGQRWVARTYGGYTRERPKFEAFFAGGSLEYELTSSLWLSLAGHYYQDTGEIENSNFSTAAPGLEASEFGFGLRFAAGHSALKLYFAPYYATRYAAIGAQTAFFRNLYKDRDLHIAQIAYSFTF